MWHHAEVHTADCLSTCTILIWKNGIRMSDRQQTTAHHLGQNCTCQKQHKLAAGACHCSLNATCTAQNKQETSSSINGMQAACAVCVQIMQRSHLPVQVPLRDAASQHHRALQDQLHSALQWCGLRVYGHHDQ